MVLNEIPGQGTINLDFPASPWRYYKDEHTGLVVVAHRQATAHLRLGDLGSFESSHMRAVGGSCFSVPRS
jgi:hypothetical protein